MLQPKGQRGALMLAAEEVADVEGCTAVIEMLACIRATD
jgi:hypothetical protein